MPLHAIVNHKDILVSKRQREKIESKELSELKDSICTNGLIHAPLVHKLEDGTFSLVVGGRRLRALTELYAEKPNFTFRFGDGTMQNGLMPVTIVSGRSMGELMRMELAENADRVALPWQDKVRAIAEIHNQLELEAAARHEKHTANATAAVILDKLFDENAASPQPDLQNSGVRKQVTQALHLAPLLASRPDLNRAASDHDAYKILLAEEHDRFARQLTVLRLSKANASSRLWRIDHVDLREGMLALDAESVDLIVVDPPYGINAHREKYAAKTYHRYDDSPQASIDLSVFIIQEGWRVTKPKANLFMFCKGKFFETLGQAARQYGWTVWYEPLIWQKSKAEGEAPWGRLGFIHTYETILYATKGQRGINGPTPDTLEFAKVGARARQHGAEKPLKLIEHLINLSTIPNDLILDPCLGVGTTTLAATRLKRRSIGMEVDQLYYNRAMARMMNFTEGGADEELEFDSPETEEDGQE